MHSRGGWEGHGNSQELTGLELAETEEERKKEINTSLTGREPASFLSRSINAALTHLLNWMIYNKYFVVHPITTNNSE